MKTLVELFVGIDVSKERLDVDYAPESNSFSADNDDKEIAFLVKRMKKRSVIAIASPFLFLAFDSNKQLTNDLCL